MEIERVYKRGSGREWSLEKEDENMDQMEANELADKWIEARFDLDDDGKRIARKAFLAGFKAAQKKHESEGGCPLPASIQEALNSGDGTYRP